MARIALNDDAEDALFRIFESTTGAERRIFRILARRAINGYVIDELETQLKGALGEISVLRTNAAEQEKA